MSRYQSNQTRTSVGRSLAKRIVDVRNPRSMDYSEFADMLNDVVSTLISVSESDNQVRSLRHARSEILSYVNFMKQRFQFESSTIFYEMDPEATEQDVVLEYYHQDYDFETPENVASVELLSGEPVKYARF